METPVTKVLRESWKNEINPIESFEKKNGVLSAQTLQYNIDNKNIHHSNLSSVPSETIMLHEPCIDDFFMNKEDGVGIVDNTEILEDWLLHIDCLLEKAEHEKGLFR